MTYILGMDVGIGRDKSAFIVTDGIVNMYGVGDSIEEAIEDYKITIKAYFDDLQEDEDNLGCNLRQHLNYLRKRF